MGKVTMRACRFAVALSACAAVFGSIAAAPAGAASRAATLPSAAQASPSPASGTQTPTWTFAPYSASGNTLERTAIHLIASPGQTVSDNAILTNYSYTQTLNFDVYGSDAYNTVKLGVFTLNPPKAPKVDVGKWITLPVNIRTVPPRQSVTFHFAVTVPMNASPGDHAGGVVALNLAPPTGVQNGTNLAIQRGSGIAVYVRVPGKLVPGVAAANIGVAKSTPPLGFGTSTARAHYSVLNTGNEVLNGKAQLEATNVFGTVVKRYKAVPIDALIPGQKMSVVEPQWSGLPFAGPVTLKLTMLTSSITGTGQAGFWVIPWLLILIIIVVLAVLIYMWIRRRRRRSNTPPPAGGTADTPDSPGPETDAQAPATVG